MANNSTDVGCAMVFDPKVSRDETDRRWAQWYAMTERSRRDRALAEFYNTKEEA